ncbi:MAG: hypothetical protein IJG88_04995 [Eggerthellaceae bacterium]|nr:hypothetical protein [Eggerthellaceae bacterium]
MDKDIRDNLPTIIVIWLIGVATCAFGLVLVRNNAASLDVGAFSWAVFLIPCAVMILAPFAITLVAQSIGKQLYLSMLGISVALGIIVMVITSGWMSDPDITAKLMANSDPSITIIPILQAPITMLRDVAAFIVCPTIGCIAGAWVGSRLHPVVSTNKKKRKKRR